MKRGLVMVLLALFGVVFVFTPAIAQEIKSQPAAGGLDKVPKGMAVLYTFTGARDNTATKATCVTCTYTGTKSSEVTVQFLDKDEDLFEVTRPLPDISGYTTYTYCSRSVPHFNEEIAISPPLGDALDQGFIRVAVTSKQAKNIICDAVVLDSENASPSFIYPLIGERSKKYKTSK